MFETLYVLLTQQIQKVMFRPPKRNFLPTPLLVFAVYNIYMGTLDKVCVYLHCACVEVFACTCVYLCIFACVFCVFACNCVCVHVCVCVCMHVCANPCMPTQKKQICYNNIWKFVISTRKLF